MNCQEALSLLYDVLDKEASQVDTQEIKQHLERCHHCFERYKLEGALHEFVVERARSMPSTERLESLKLRILNTIDQISETQAAPAKKKSAYLISISLSVAASLFVVVGVYLLSSAIYRHNEEYMPLESAHWSATNSFESGQLAVAETVAGSTASELHYQIEPLVGAFQLVGSKSETIEGVATSHFLYKNGGEYVSVFVMAAGDYQIPDDLLKSKIEKNSYALYDHNCRGCRMVYHMVGDALVVTAATERDIQLLDFFPGHSVI
ncbi:MAG: zf-HC2 domain-containing protein [Candidatus Zixiibacteriota bacterium]